MMSPSRAKRIIARDLAHRAVADALDWGIVSWEDHPFIDAEDWYDIEDLALTEFPAAPTRREVQLATATLTARATAADDDDASAV